jgi:pimeloyl-ACP methyl ester carboxylesterase
MPSAAPHATGEAAVNGTRLYYERAGRGPSVVLVSGGGMLDRRQWDDQFDVLAREYDVVTYDIRGIGRSARPDGECAHHDDLRALLEHLQIASAIICGVSFGAAIAIDFALDYPAMVNGLVLGCAGVSSDPEGVQAARDLAAIVQADGIDRAIDLVVDLPTFISSANQSARSRIREIYLDNRDVFEAGFPLATAWRPTTPPARGRLQTIAVPTLVVVGGRDHPGALAGADNLVASIAGAERIVIDDAAHMLNMDAPAALTRAIQDFLQRHPQRMQS